MNGPNRADRRRYEKRPDTTIKIMEDVKALKQKIVPLLAKYKVHVSLAYDSKYTSSRTYAANVRSYLRKLYNVLMRDFKKEWKERKTIYILQHTFTEKDKTAFNHYVANEVNKFLFNTQRMLGRELCRYAPKPVERKEGEPKEKPEQAHMNKLLDEIEKIRAWNPEPRQEKKAIKITGIERITAGGNHAWVTTNMNKLIKKPLNAVPKKIYKEWLKSQNI